MDYRSWTTSMNWFNYLKKQIDDGLRSTWWGRSCNNDVLKQKAVMQYLCLKILVLDICAFQVYPLCSVAHAATHDFFLRIVSSLPRRSKTRHPTKTFLIWINLSCILINLSCIFELSSAHTVERARARAIFLCLIVVLREWFYLFLKKSALSARYFCFLLLCL